MPAAPSLPQLHMLAILSTEIARRARDRTDGPLRILEVGCGKGDLIVYLARSLPAVFPDLSLEYFAYDVHDYLSHDVSDVDRLVASLRQRCPHEPWERRVTYIATNDPWPYESEFFDAIISTHVLEHVADHDALFGEMSRTLREGGFAVHLFPLRHQLLEGHVKLPIVHRFSDHDRLTGYIRLMSRLGLGRYRRDPGLPLDDFCERYADYIHYYTCYRSARELTALAKRHRLRLSFRYTKEFYLAKLRSLLGMRPRPRYARPRWWMVDALSFAVLKYLSSITVVLEKKNVRAGHRVGGLAHR